MTVKDGLAHILSSLWTIAPTREEYRKPDFAEYVSVAEWSIFENLSASNTSLP
jgi:hypothetical protein